MMNTADPRLDTPKPVNDAVPKPHPRTIGWFGATALAMGGSNQSLFLISALFIGQGDILGQGSAAVPLLIAGLLLSWAAAPGWIELVLMYPDRVGGISASCAEAFRPYSPVLANLTGVCYWWGWVPTCGLTALLSAAALHEWYFPGLSVKVMAVGLVLLFAFVNLCGIKWVCRLAMPVATLSALLAFLSALLPVIDGSVDWRQATTFHLTSPFPGWFGELTSLMAGLYLIGFAAPAFEAAACHVGEMVEPNKSLPRAMFASGLLAGLYFIALPLIWLGTLGAEPLGKDLALVLGPTFAPLFGGAAKAAAIWFMVLSMFSGTMQPLAGAARTLSQLSEDGLLPRILARRARHTDAPWVATLLTAGMAILFLLIGDPVWLIAAANFTYLIGIALPSVAVWLLRRNAPLLARPWRAPRGTVTLGLWAALVWGVAALLGFEQFGLPTVLIGLALAYSGSLAYAWRKFFDRRAVGLPGVASSLHLKLTGSMMVVILLDGAGYLLAVQNIPMQQSALMTILSDIFVAVAMLTVSVGLVLPGMIAHSVVEVSTAARRLASGTVAEFSRAMQALGRGDLDGAHASVAITPVYVGARDEVGEMANSFNTLQFEVANAAAGLDGAREGLRHARRELIDANRSLELRVEELRNVEEKMSGILESIDVVLWSVAAVDHALLYLNPAAHVVYGRPVEDFLADPRLWVEAVHPDDRLRVRHWLSEVLRKDALTLQYRIVRPGGEVRWLEDRARLVRDSDGQPLRWDGVATDISERKTRDARIEYLANYDALTGLPNRNLLVNRLEQSLHHAQRAQRRVGLLFLDIDQFKFINDSYGHALGDVLLKSIAARLESVVRDGDTVARLGGDEFVIMLTDVGAIEDVGDLARKVLHAFAQPTMADGRKLYVTTSIGVAIYPEDGGDGDMLLKHADVAMYRAKAQGRNCVQSYTPEMGTRALERVELEHALRQAVEHHEFELHYQPQVDLASGQIISVEALLRWHHPQLGMVSPGRFIRLAEETGLIIPIGEWALRTACKQARAWQVAGYEVSVAVNVSGRQFEQQSMPQLVRTVLDATGLPAANLELELTESMLMQDSEMMIATLGELKSIGVGLSIDDFGTGFSSLSYLTRFPIDILKIDQSFVLDITRKREAASITLAMIALAKGLGLRTIAEGVETREQLEFLKANKCDAIQGYYFSPALPAAEITVLLRQGQRYRFDGEVVNRPRHTDSAI